MSQGHQEPFANIPPEVIIEILSRIPLRSIINCKCVCKLWLTLLESNEFVKSHLLKSIPVLALYRIRSKFYKFFDFEEGHNLEHHGLHYKSVTKFRIPGCNGWISGSANGLLFLRNRSNLHKHHALHICNPITRDYIKLDCSEFAQYCADVVTYGFGSSKITGQHKVVRIFQGYVRAPGDLSGLRVPNSECVCHIYTIGTRVWRRISHVAHFAYAPYSKGTFLNGNLHWLVSEFEGPQLRISCFDLETECFSRLSAPPVDSKHLAGPTILGDCLCLCDNSHTDGIVIWLMKDYGVEESWTKQFLIVDAWPLDYEYLYEDAVNPIKIFNDGDILFAREHEFLFYSKKNRTVQRLERFEPHNDINAVLYTPSFLSLRSFGMERVISF